MKKALLNIIIIVYVIIAITVTVFLLAYNEYRVTEIGDYSLLIINSDEIATDHEKGSLVIAKKNNLSDVKAGDKLFFYEDKEIQYGEVVDIHSYENAGSTFIMEGDLQLVEDNVIGADKDTTSISNLGTILGIIESKWGFLFLIVFPSLIAFFREVLALIVELKGNDYRGNM